MRVRTMKKHRHSKPLPQQYVVTQYAGAVASSPAPLGNWSGNATNTNILGTPDTVLAVCDTNVPGSTDNTLTVGNFGFDAVLPSDAVISKVEVIPRNKWDGVTLHPRPGILERVNGTLASVSFHEQTEATISTTLADFTWDITADAAASAWGTWTRATLLNAAFQIGVRARSTVATDHSNISWDCVAVRVTYTGSPPGTPVAAIRNLTVSTAGTGAGKITGPGIDTSAGDSAQSFPDGSQVAILATPNAGSIFTNWSGNASGINPATTLEMNADKTAVANFGGQPAGGYLAAHTGGVLAEDLLLDADPLVKWKQVNDPYYYGSQPGYDYASDPYITRLSGAGADTHVPIGQVAAPANWRKHKVTPGVQDSFDAGVPNDKTRTQLVNNSRTNTFWLSVEGAHNWHIFTHRRHGADSLPLVYDGSSSPGISKTSQVAQWKTFLQAGGQDPILSILEWNDGYHLNYNNQITGDKFGWFIPAANNVWVRFRLECLWTTNAAAATFSLWADIGGGAEQLVVGPITGFATLYANTAGAAGDISHGPYVQMNLPTADYFSEYGAWQVCSYV